MGTHEDDLAARERFPDRLMKIRTKRELLDMVRENWLIARRMKRERDALKSDKEGAK
jgi:hypothetical protein